MCLSVCLGVRYYVFYAYIGQVPEIKLMIMMMMINGF